MQLILADYIKGNPCFAKRIEEASELINWWNNHSRALALFLQEQKTRTPGSALALIRAIVTRWTSHQMALQRLLRVKKSLQSCVVHNREDLLAAGGVSSTEPNSDGSGTRNVGKQKTQEKTRRILARSEDNEFYEDITV